MKLETAITKRILSLCEERGITPNKLASLAGLSTATIRMIFYGKSKNPGTRTLLDICEALDINSIRFFQSPTFQVTRY